MSKSSFSSANKSLIKEWHPTKNAPLTPKDVALYSHKKIWWICNKDNTHIWKTAVSVRTSNGSGCPFCTSRSVSPQNCLAKLNPKLTKEWHPTKNGSLTPNDVTSNSHKKAWWLCNKDNSHEWKADISSRNIGRGCPYCSNRSANSQNCLATKNERLAKEWHQTKNGSLTPKDVTPGSERKVWWFCKKDNNHNWEATVKSRTYGSDCPFCAGKAVNIQNLSTYN
jgi:hypothetical protein